MNKSFDLLITISFTGLFSFWDTNSRHPFPGHPRPPAPWSERWWMQQSRLLGITGAERTFADVGNCPASCSCLIELWSPQALNFAVIYKATSPLCPLGDIPKKNLPSTSIHQTISSQTAAPKAPSFQFIAAITYKNESRFREGPLEFINQTIQSSK